MKIKTIVALLVLTVLLVAGCSDRGVNYDRDVTEIKAGGDLTKTHVFYSELLFQMQNKFQQMPFNSYWPNVAFEIGDGGQYQSVPLLILLPPQDGNSNYYFQHGLREIADEMIANGEIQPMAILCIPNDKIYGGYFYAGNSPAAGFYDDLIGKELVRYAEEEFFVNTIRTQEKRAIGGFGMGAYGAYRAAIMNPGVFGAVSGFAGPMDFDGADNASGFMDLFDDALNEQGLMGQDLQNPITGFNYQGDWHVSRLFVGGGFAFASQTTGFDVDTVTSFPFNQLPKLVYTLNSSDSLPTDTFPAANVITFPGFSVPPNTFENSVDYTFGFYLPFDSTGGLVAPVWERWMQNNLDSLLADPSNNLDGVQLWMGNSSESTFGNYNDQTNSWIAHLKNAGLAIQTYNMVGYDGHPANKDQYMYDILRELLLFHSESFGN